MSLSAIVVLHVTCDLPVVPIPIDPLWSHITNLRLTDPEFGKPGRIDFLLGVDVFAGVLCQGRRCGPSYSHIAFETEFGWVLAGSTTPTDVTSSDVVVHHTTMNSCDDLLRKFWEIEETASNNSPRTSKERFVAQQMIHCLLVTPSIHHWWMFFFAFDVIA